MRKAAVAMTFALFLGAFSATPARAQRCLPVPLPPGLACNIRCNIEYILYFVTTGQLPDYTCQST
jgi:hypothetical protein